MFIGACVTDSEDELDDNRRPRSHISKGKHTVSRIENILLVCNLVLVYASVLKIEKFLNLASQVLFSILGEMILLWL